MPPCRPPRPGGHHRAWATSLLVAVVSAACTLAPIAHPSPSALTPPSTSLPYTVVTTGFSPVNGLHAALTYDEIRCVLAGVPPGGFCPPSLEPPPPIPPHSLLILFTREFGTTDVSTSLEGRTLRLDVTLAAEGPYHGPMGVAVVPPSELIAVNRALLPRGQLTIELRRHQPDVETRVQETTIDLPA